jgi:N-acyl-D-amino-acid deacylase
MYDLLIRNALVLDGSGSEAFVADVAVRHGRIVEVGPAIAADAVQVVDGTGLALMPGIIDSHTHFDAQITWDAYVRPSPGGIATGHRLGL